MFHCRTHVQDCDQREMRRGEERRGERRGGEERRGEERRGEERRGEERRGRRGEETEWQQEGEENLIPIDKDIFNPLSLCFIAGHTYRIMTRGRPGEERRGEERRGEERRGEERRGEERRGEERRGEKTRQNGNEKERRTLYQ